LVFDDVLAEILLFELFFWEVDEGSLFFVGKGELIIKLSALIFEKRIIFVLSDSGDGFKRTGFEVFEFLTIKVLSLEVEVVWKGEFVLNLIWIGRIVGIDLDSFSEEFVVGQIVVEVVLFWVWGERVGVYGGVDSFETHGFK
jgi:hypothetical protein